MDNKKVIKIFAGLVGFLTYTTFAVNYQVETIVVSIIVAAGFLGYKRLKK